MTKLKFAAPSTAVVVAALALAVASLVPASASRRSPAVRRWGAIFGSSHSATHAGTTGTQNEKSLADEKVQTIRILDKPLGQFTYVDNGVPSFSQGDEMMFSDTLFRDGEKVGRLDVDRIVTGLNRVNGEIVGGHDILFLSATLPGGEIVATGTNPYSPETVLPVTGGSGAFETVEAGEVHLTFLHNGNLRLRYELFRP